MDVFTLRGKVTGGFTDEEFFWFCQENKDLRIERTSNLEIIIMSPVTTLSGFWNMEIARQLANWAADNGQGFAFESSAGFTLPDHSVFAPDASWVSKEKWNSLTDNEKDRFAPVCPEFVIEVRSKSDQLNDLKEKMQTWLANGTQLAWLVDPIDQTTFIFKKGLPEKIVKGFDKKIDGEGIVKGFVLDLSLIKL